MTHVLAIGVFDLFHVGHLRYLQYARQLGDHLTVAVCPDKISLAIKGKSPVIIEDQRLEVIKGLACVDKAEYMPTSTEFAKESANWIASWGIQHVVVGGCWQGSTRWESLTPLLVKQGIAVSFAPQTTDISTTLISRKVHEAYTSASPVIESMKTTLLG